MPIPLQPILENDRVTLFPLEESDFEALYAVASDPKVWEQHPNKDRWQRDVFRTFFDGAMQSRGAFRIVDKNSGQVIGSTRFYDLDESQCSIKIGYTFYGTASWGTGINSSVKALMLAYIFRFLDSVFFQVGAQNLRSQIAVRRIGAEKIGEEPVAYFGEGPRLNFLYVIKKEDWLRQQAGVQA